MSHCLPALPVGNLIQTSEVSIMAPDWFTWLERVIAYMLSSIEKKWETIIPTLTIEKTLMPIVWRSIPLPDP